jgi:GT2 family glycosyltransferase
MSELGVSDPRGDQEAVSIPASAVAAEQAAPLVACILVNWNGWKDTIECVDSLGKIDYPNMSVILVDNGSTNDSVERVRAKFPDLEIVESTVNHGFGGGNNLGIRLALDRGAKYIWLLNNDTIVESGTLTALVAAAEADPTLGEIGCVLHYAHDPARVEAWGGGPINVWTGMSGHYHEPVPSEKLDYLTAASVMIPAKVFAQVGLFDEGYFMYWEDVDLSFRIRAAGWKLGVANDSRLLHKGGASTGWKSPAHNRLMSASAVRFFRKFSPIAVVPTFIFVGGRAFKRFLHGEWALGRAALAGLNGAKG